MSLLLLCTSLGTDFEYLIFYLSTCLLFSVGKDLTYTYFSFGIADFFLVDFLTYLCIFSLLHCILKILIKKFFLCVWSQ